MPDFLIVGAARSGTTSLYYDLGSHPQVFVPEVKEPFFFSFLGRPPEGLDPEFAANKRWSLDEYASLFAPAREGQLLGEASTSYLYTWRDTIRNLSEIYGERMREIRIIAILRDPVERTFSHWKTIVRNGTDDLEFSEFLDPEFVAQRRQLRWDYDWQGFGSYSKGIQAFKEAFPRVHVILNEDLADRETCLRDLCAFLDLDPALIESSDYVANAGGLPRTRFLRWLFLPSPLQAILRPLVSDRWRSRLSVWRWRLLQVSLSQPDMTADQRGFLQDSFRRDVQQLAAVLDRDLGAWGPLQPNKDQGRK